MRGGSVCWGNMRRGGCPGGRTDAQDETDDKGGGKPFGSSSEIVVVHTKKLDPNVDLKHCLLVLNHGIARQPQLLT